MKKLTNSTIKTIFVVPLSHLDIGFTAPQDDVARQYKTYIDQVLAYLDEDPDFSYTIETVWQYLQWERQTTDKTAPARLMEYARQGRLSIGAAFASMHTGMLGMEELHRVFYHAGELRRRFGIPLKTAWMNDIPGYNWALPRTLQAAGIKYFLTGINTSLGGGADIPSSSLPFYWQGPGGSRVLTWISKRNYLEGWTDYHLNEDDEAMEAGITKVLGEWADEGYPYDTVLAIGAAGDNLGPDIARTFVQRAKAWNEKGHPVRVVVGTAEQFFAHMERRYAGQFPIISGEWNGLWEFARGQNSGGTAIARQTRFSLPGIEALAALSSVSSGTPYPKEALHTAYERLLTYDEHSQGNGNGWPKLLTREQVVRHNKIALTLAQEAAMALDQARLASGSISGSMSETLTKSMGGPVTEPIARSVASMDGPMSGSTSEMGDPTEDQHVDVLVYNGLSWPRSGVVDGPVRFWAEDVAPFGFRRYKLPVQSWEPVEKDLADQTILENRWYRVTVNQRGDVTSIIDRHAGRECIDQKAAFHWNQLSRNSRQNKAQPEATTDPTKVSMVGKTSDLADEIVIRRDGHGLVESRIILPKNAPRVEFHHVVDMAIIEADPGHHRTDWYTLMFPFAVDPKRCEFMFDTAAGVIRPGRDMIQGAPRGAWAVQSAVAWQEGSEKPWAIAVAHRQSFLWSAVPFRRLSADPAPSNPMIASVLFSLNDTGETKDQGHVTFTFNEREPIGTTKRTFSYALTTWSDSFDDTALIRFGYEWNTPLMASTPVLHPTQLTQEWTDSTVAPGSLISVDAPNVMITAVKLPEDAPLGSTNELIIRLQEIAGEPTTPVHVRLNHVEVERAVICNLLEQPYADAGWALPTDPVRLTIGAKEVLTLRLQWRDRRVRV